MTIKPKFYWPGKSHEKWKECTLCRELKKWVELHYYSGSVEPVVGECLTGATSGDTGTVSSVTLFSGSWAGGDAAGIVEFSSYTGLDSESESIFEKDENLNGSTGGTNMLTAKWIAGYKVSGIIHPKRVMTKREGRWYCEAHHDFKFIQKDRDEQKVDISEKERYKE